MIDGQKLFVINVSLIYLRSNGFDKLKYVWNMSWSWKNHLSLSSSQPPPSVIIIITTTTTVNGEEKFLPTSYDLICQIKPKFFVASSCSMWSSHLFDNRHNSVALHQVFQSVDGITWSCPEMFRFIMLQDILRSYVSQTNQHSSLAFHPSINFFVKYEIGKIGFLLKWWYANQNGRKR